MSLPVGRVGGTADGAGADFDGNGPGDGTGALAWSRLRELLPNGQPSANASACDESVKADKP